jgi:uncharacterized protein (DUF779 family)
VSDIRARLADALREHPHMAQWRTCGCCNGQPSPPICDADSHADHLADVLLSLPGIAIVELPAPYHDEDTYQAWRFFEHGEDEYVTWPACVSGEGADISISGMGGYSGSEARALAAALLAAAVQAQEEG